MIKTLDRAPAQTGSMYPISGDEAPPVRIPQLEEELRQTLDGEVRFDEGSRALYATDASNYRMPPIGVVVPRHRQDIVEAVRLCRKHRAPLLTRGGGTSLAGQCCNVAVVLDLSKYYNRILSIDPARRLATVEAGLVLDELQKAVAPHDLIFGPNPATHNHCTIGGMIGNNSCGINSVMSAFAGNGPRTSDNLHEMEVLLYDGTILRVGPTSENEWEEIVAQGGRRGKIYAQLRTLRDRYGDLVRERYPKIPRRVSGFNLDDLLPENGCNVARALAGSEGTCAVILSATLRLIPRPKARALVVLGYPDAFSAGDHVPGVLRFKPIGLEGIDDKLVNDLTRQGVHDRAIKTLPEGKGWLLVEFGGENGEACAEQAHGMMDELRRADEPPAMEFFKDTEEAEKIWEAREAGLGATAFVQSMDDTWEGWEDSAVAPEKLGDYLRELRALFARYDYHPALYGHFGQGCVHCRVTFDLVTKDGIEKFRRFLDEASDLVVRFGGSFSGEHGDGQSRADLLPKLFGPELIEAFEQFKAAWDPDWKLNPGKVVRPNPITSHLRLGTDYNPSRPETYFKFPNDHGDFSRAVLRCVGVGECRRHEYGTMCPSYMVTREEKHSTRGRARLLFEMLQGDLVKGGFRDEHVKDALDLCLACKGCRNECPVHVDVATYKAEFLAHYYEGRLRPLHAYAFGYISRWARLASLAPRVVNFFQRAPYFSDAMKWLIGVAPERRVPRFARETFKSWFFRRPPRNSGGPRVILWPDTFNNHFHPEVARAATEFLEAAGWRVIVPKAALCCGRPLYDYGLVATAQRWLEKIVDALRPEIRAGVPMIGLEPSCAATFRDELLNLLPDDRDAQRLSRQTYLLSEFIEAKMPDHPLPSLPRHALVHGHCHHKAIMTMDAEVAVLRRMKVDHELIDSGCCGMAGAFGFEEKHYEVAIQAGERVLLPTVRAAGDESVIVANGFSCREQIAQTTTRCALHLAQLLELARRESGGGMTTTYPEHACEPREPKDPTKAQAVLAIAAGAAVLGGAGYWWMRRRRLRKTRRAEISRR